MLELAIRAGLPLIKITTDDTVNFPRIVAHAAGEEVAHIEQEDVVKLGTQGYYSEFRIFYVMHPDEMDYGKAYKDCVGADRILIVVNPDVSDPAMFNAGAAKLPKIMLQEFLDEVAESDQVEHLMSSLGGLSMKDVAEVCRLCMAENDSLTPRGITHIRRMFMSGLRGVQQVDTNYSFYQPIEKLVWWLEVDGKIFKRYDVLPELVPRGLLFDGVPGTGKTMAAKYLANKLEMPLFRLDLGGLMAKYVGESEGNLNAALAQVDSAEPCILLIDEVEKVFKSGEDAGVTSRLLSQLLWWLQEHSSRVLTLMTTNDREALPAEMYRPGRIDSVITYPEFKSNEAVNFATDLMKEYGQGLPVDPKQVIARVEFAYSKEKSGHSKKMTPASVTQLIYWFAKRGLVKK